MAESNGTYACVYYGGIRCPVLAGDTSAWARLGRSLRIGGVLVIAQAIFLHAIWGMLLLIDVSASWATPTHELSMFIQSPRMLSAVLFAATAAAVLSLCPMCLPSLARVVLILPQQMLLSISMVGAGTAIWTSQYSDGVLRPMSFIFADQLPVILLALAHTVAIFLVHTRPSWKAGQSP